MQPDTNPVNVLVSPLIHVRIDPSGQHTAEVPGLPGASATAATREAAIEQLRCILVDWLRTGRLVSLPVVVPMTPRKPPGWAENDPLEQEFLDELARRRREDLERTLREYEEEDRACPGSSSTPTT